MSTQAIRYDVPAEEYFATPALSNSGMKDLAVSPYRFWYRHINPNRPADEPTKEMVFGSALHCLVLEPEKFEKRYGVAAHPDDYEGCLVTCDDMRAFLMNAGETPKGTLKAGLIKQVQSISSSALIFDVIQRVTDAANEGKTILGRDDMARVHSCANSLLSEPIVKRLLGSGDAEVSMRVTHPESGVPLKARMDFVTDTGLIVDVKTFQQMRGKSIDRSVADAIYYEGYHRQAVFYDMVRQIATGQKSEFIFLFVESVDPHEVRIRKLVPKMSGTAHVYWSMAKSEIRRHMDTYAACMNKFGENPWRIARDIDVLVDDEIPALAY